MNTEILQQEILLFTGTTFSQREFCQNDAKDDRSNSSKIQKLEEACWSGLLSELLPEILTNRKLCIWRIENTELSLQIELALYPFHERQFSINPYYFLRTTGWN